MKFPFSARLGAYLAIFGLLCELGISWIDRVDHSYRDPFVYLFLGLPIAYGAVLIIRPSIAQFWERNDLFERATRAGFISSATRQLNAEAGGFFGHLPSKLRRQVPPERHRLKLPVFAVLYSTVLIFVIPFMATWVMATLLPGPGIGLRAYVAGPSGMVQPWMEPAYEKLVVKVKFQQQWFLGSNRITEAEADRLWRMLEDPRRHEVRTFDRLTWYLNLKPMTEAAMQGVLKEELSRRGSRFVYLELPHDAPFRVAIEAIEAVNQTPGTKVVLVTGNNRPAGKR